MSLAPIFVAVFGLFFMIVAVISLHLTSRAEVRRLRRMLVSAEELATAYRKEADAHALNAEAQARLAETWKAGFESMTEHTLPMPDKLL